MKIVISSASFAHSAEFAMELLFARVVVKQITYVAKVFTERETASITALRWRLDVQTSVAFDLPHRLLIKRVRRRVCPLPA